MLPSGTVTFVFTDIEGSTRLWETQGEAMASAQKLHDSLVASAIEEAGGHVVKFLGDGSMSVFADAGAAIAAAVDLQRRLSSACWESTPLRARIGVHTAPSVNDGGDYHGSGVNRASRVADAAHGGQVLVSETTAAVAMVPAGLVLRSLGKHRLRDLREPIELHQVDGEGLTGEFPPLRSLDAVSHNLPPQRSGFVGRSRELAAIRASLRQSRLTTLTGIGGVGKTRLALQAAAEHVTDYPDGVRLIQLAGVSTAQDVIGSIAEGSGLTGDPREGPVDHLPALTRLLQRRRLLLLLDNAEHVLEECARVAHTLLDECQSLSLLVTSREPLGVEGERVRTVEPLPVSNQSEEGSGEAVSLFVDRALEVKDDFTLDEESRRAVHSICRQVDGIPLAIELAAARVAHLTPIEIASRLDDRMGLLSARNRTTPERHRTLTAMLDWSHDLLPEDERTLFRRLAVFASSADLDLVEGICPLDDLEPALVLDLLSSLVDKSLVVPEAGEERTRFRLLATVRRYARARMEEAGEAEAVQEAHARWFAGRLQDLQAQSVQELEVSLQRHFDDILAALQWTTRAGHLDLACQIAAFAWRRWEMTGRLVEGRQLLSALLEDPAAAASPAFPAVVNGAANLALAAGDTASARALHQANLDRHRSAGDVRGEAQALNGLALITLFERRIEEAGRLVTAALDRWEELGDEAGKAYSLTTRGMVERARGAREAASDSFLSALALLRKEGHKRDAASVLNNLGNLAHDAGDLLRAHRFHEGALNLQRELGNDRGAALSLNNLSIVARERGDPYQAAEFAEEARRLFERIGDSQGIAPMLNNLANLAEEQDDPERAIELYQQAIERFRENGDGWGMATTLENLADVAIGTDRLQLGWDSLLDAVAVHLRNGRQGQAALSLTRLSGLAGGLGLAQDALLVLGLAQRLLGADPTEPPAALVEAVKGELTDAEVRAALGSGGGVDPESLVLQLRSVPLPALPEGGAGSEREGPAGVLTTREREVASLIGSGLSNREIAEQLFISERTVDSHVTHIRTKTGITSRTQLALWAARHV